MKFQIGTSSLHHSSNVQSQIGTCLNKKMDDIAIIENKIYEIRGQKVMLDFDLAEMYGVETKRLKEQVRRNIERFPAEFMFELTKEEVAISRSQIATLNIYIKLSQNTLTYIKKPCKWLIFTFRT